MKNFDKDEFLELINKLLKDQYGTMDEEQIPDNAWLPSESPFKQKLISPNYSTVIDLTDCKSSELYNTISSKLSNIKVGNFIIRISKCHYHINKLEGINLYLHEEKKTTHLGKMSKITSKIDIHNDIRFNKCIWISYFNSSRLGESIPLNTLVDIVRWLQGLNRLSAFV